MCGCFAARGSRVLEAFQTAFPEHRLKARGKKFPEVELPLLLSLCSHANIGSFVAVNACMALCLNVLFVGVGASPLCVIRVNF